MLTGCRRDVRLTEGCRHHDMQNLVPTQESSSGGGHSHRRHCGTPPQGPRPASSDNHWAERDSALEACSYHPLQGEQASAGSVKPKLSQTSSNELSDRRKLLCDKAFQWWARIKAPRWRLRRS